MNRFLSIIYLAILCVFTNTPMKANTRIVHSSWGKTIVEHNASQNEYEDCRIWSTGSEKWDWKRTNTHHRPGIQIADVKDLIDKADIFVLSLGMDHMLEVMSETISFLIEKNKEVFLLQTPEAVNKYNELAQQGKSVAALIHATC